MSLTREHSSKLVLVRFRDGTYWEEWQLRFNRGNKQSKPVKFFAERTWQSHYSVTLCPFSGMRFDSVSEQYAENYFASEILKHEGAVIQTSKRLAKELNEKFGYMPYAQN